MRLKKKSPDFLLFAIVLVLLTIGIIMVFSSSAVSAAQEFGDPYYYLKRQLMWAFLGSLAMIFVMEIDYFRYAKYIELFLIGSFILLGLVLVAGISSHGSSRWLGVGFLRIQPSEVMKLAMVLFLSKSMSRHPERIQSFQVYSYQRLGGLRFDLPT